MKNTEIAKHNHLDIIDELTKQLSQTKAVIRALAMDEHFKMLSSSDLANMLWVIDDGLSNISKSSSELINHIQNNNNK